MTRFGETPRPGGEPPPRQPLTEEQRRYRETFTRAEHLANATPEPRPSETRSAPPQASGGVFDENAVRESFRQVGMEFVCRIFPIGEEPQDLGFGSQRQEARIAELESERVIMRTRALSAESAAAGSIRELGALQTRFDVLQSKFDTLQTELEAVKAEKSQPDRGTE